MVEKGDGRWAVRGLRRQPRKRENRLREGAAVFGRLEKKKIKAKGKERMSGGCKRGKEEKLFG